VPLQFRDAVEVFLKMCGNGGLQRAELRSIMTADNRTKGVEGVRACTSRQQFWMEKITFSDAPMTCHTTRVQKPSG
jgi:hypothetical protein